VKDHEQHLQDLEKSQEVVKRDVLRFQEREKYLKRVEDLMKKKPWVEFEDQRNRAIEAKTERDAAVATFDEYDKKKQEPLKEQIL
jgi:hypothetical protein